MSCSIALALSASLFGAASSVLWWRAASIVIPDNAFISELQRAGRCSSWAARCASVAAALAAVGQFAR